MDSINKFDGKILSWKLIIFNSGFFNIKLKNNFISTESFLFTYPTKYSINLQKLNMTIVIDY
jgi:hypothetical protein